MIFTRTTEVESYLACPHKAVHAPFVQSVEMLKKTYMGDIGHKAHQDPAVAEKMTIHFCDVVLPSIEGERDNILKDHILQVIEHGKRFIEYHKEHGNELIYEAKSNIHSGNVISTGTLDCLVRYKSGEYEVIDFKIVKSDSSYKEPRDRIQSLFYAYKAMELYGLDSIRFSYYCYIKNKTIKEPKKYVAVYTMQEAKEAIKERLETFAGIKERGLDYPIKSSACYQCPLYRSEKAKALGKCKCPAREFEKSGSFDI